jgi:transcriptional regulator with AAA-type ATPase domain
LKLLKNAFEVTSGTVVWKRRWIPERKALYPQGNSVNWTSKRLQFSLEMAKSNVKDIETACPDCGAMIKIDAASGLVVSHTSAPRKRMFEDLETAAKEMREQEERKESIFRQSVDAERNKDVLMEKKFAEALRKAKDAPEGKPLRDFDLD